MTCLFCRANSTEAKGVAHVFPEALVRNETTLPRGAVCDACNNYMGRKLDSQILEHPLIPLIVQLAGLPGKGGKTRKKLGHVEREADGTVHVPINEPDIKGHPQGGTQTSFDLVAGQAYDDRRFSRALHHIALCIFCKHFGSPAALNARLDPVRSYVRSPGVGEFWPYGSEKGNLNQLRLELTGGPAPGAPQHLIQLRIFNLDFSVSLFQDDAVARWASASPARQTVLTPAEITKEQRGRRRYRVSFRPED